MKSYKYTGITPRVKALVTDVIIQVAVMFIVVYLFSLFDNIPNVIRMVTFISIFFLYEPILISFYGGSVGHMLNDISVRQDKYPEKFVILPIAILRFFIKALFGWLSFITIIYNPKGKAIHDYVARTVVIDTNDDVGKD